MSTTEGSPAEQGAAPSQGERALELISGMLSADQFEVSRDRDQVTITVPVDSLMELATALRDEPATAYEMPVTMTCVDWPEREPRFDVIYLLRSLVHNDLARLRVAGRGGDAGAV
ncbi:NADH dehydrogenase, subunit C, partial [mine drainage metagenome]